jgi:hypothetical protein
MYRFNAYLREAAGEGTPGGIPGMPPPPAPPSSDVDINRLVQTVEAQGATLNKLVERIGQPAPPAAPPAPARPTTPDLEAEFWKNPVSVAETIARKAVNDAAAMPNPSFDTLVTVARNEARNRDPKIFDLLLPEITIKVEGMPPQFRQSSSVWNNAFNMAVGENMDKVIAERTRAAAPAPAPSGGGPAAPSPRAASAPPVPKLTDEERTFCGRFGLSEDGYRRGKSRYEGQGSGAPDKPSSWDEVITFDSDKANRARREAELKGKK